MKLYFSGNLAKLIVIDSAIYLLILFWVTAFLENLFEVIIPNFKESDFRYFINKDFEE